jgi:hypothetical protein
MQAQAAAPKAFGAAAVFERRVWNNLFQSTLSKSYFFLRRLPNREWTPINTNKWIQFASIGVYSRLFFVALVAAMPRCVH